jgi:hypothetical protein
MNFGGWVENFGWMYIWILSPEWLDHVGLIGAYAMGI